MPEEPKWYEAYPAPRNEKTGSVSASELLDQLKSGVTPGREILLVDLRRTDHEVRVMTFAERYGN